MRQAVSHARMQGACSELATACVRTEGVFLNAHTHNKVFSSQNQRTPRRLALRAYRYLDIVRRIAH
jgi:hypothetical protein